MKKLAITTAFISLTLPAYAGQSDYVVGSKLAQRCFKSGFECHIEARQISLEALAGYDIARAVLELSANNQARGKMFLIDFNRSITIMGLTPDSVCREVISSPPTICDALK